MLPAVFCHSVLPHQSNYRGHILGVDDSSSWCLIEKKKSPERSTFPRLKVWECVRTAYTHGYTQSSTRRTGWTAGDKGGEQEARMCRVFTLWGSLSQYIQPSLTLPPRVHAHTHTRCIDTAIHNTGVKNNRRVKCVRDFILSVTKGCKFCSSARVHICRTHTFTLFGRHHAGVQMKTDGDMRQGRDRKGEKEGAREGGGAS